MTVTAHRNAESASDASVRDDRDAFLTAMGNAVTGVTVVATDGPGGLVAQTVSAMCSVSADPPTVLVCVHLRSPLCESLLTNGYFSVNVLSAAQSDVADTFAGRPRHGAPYDFRCATWSTGQSGSPLLVGAVATFDCRLARSLVVGTHRIFFGHVLNSQDAPGESMTYQCRTYGRHHQIAS